MFGTENLLLFVISGLLLNITPGADILYIVGRSSSQGGRGGSVAALGIGAGCLVHILSATVGISALIAASATAFTVVKYVGAAYLVFIGITMLRTRKNGGSEVKPLPPTRLSTIFWQGFLTNALNPKVALFFLAFLPQFVAPDAAHKSLAFLFLGILFNVNGTLWNLFVAWASSNLAARFHRPGQLTPWLNRAIGALFLYFGVRLAVLHT
ncbi:LysE family translocator [Desulfofustis limnaeus]|jgi:threonine/homoserine/homoserine lactone efflux protein|uniref:Lysine transporter LysE n=1 Tax=Desulfofustis limnaeus TaxID=2740163 RepID=A0ABN6M3C4_9BACT|nr:LysE family translocator [Desulfofustis limnaeus]MDX9895276.1 LysE family translocator [Desulfofustis sp.]BDD86529.1 lysine transporter LysE [Desulfofustis limnaeus]